MTGRGVCGTALASALLVACSATKDCTVIGCPPSVTVEAPRGIPDLSAGALTVCVDGECSEAAFVDVPPAARAVATVGAPEAEPGDEVTAVLVMLDGAELRADGAMAEDRPNGPGCSPVCVVAQLTLSAG